MVQVYLRNTADAEGPIKTLRAYKRIMLKAGDKQTVEIDFPRSSFECWDASTNTMRVMSGTYEIMVGNSSASSNLKSITVKVK